MKPLHHFRKCALRGWLAALAAVLALAVTTGHTATLPDEGSYFAMLKNQYQNHLEDDSDALLGELALFRDLFPRSSRLDSVNFFMAHTYEKNKFTAGALATYLRIVFVYPSSPLIPDCLLNLQRLASAKKGWLSSKISGDELMTIKAFILKILEDELKSPGGEQGLLEFIQMLGDASVRPLADYTALECRHYLYRLGCEAQADRVMLIRGDQYSLKKQWRSAILAYRTVPLIDPIGRAVPESMLKTGHIYFRELENYKMASSIYSSVEKQYPASIEAAQASIYQAEVLEEQKEYSQAVIKLEDTVKRFPFPEIRMDGYGRIARLYTQYLNDPEKAVLACERHVSEFPEEAGSVDMLIRIGELHEKKTGKHADAIGAYRRLAELFPDYRSTPERLLHAADLAEEKLKDSSLATTLYKQVAADYPKTEPGRQAASFLRTRK